MRLLSGPAVLFLGFVMLAGGAGQARAATLLWQVSPQGSAASFDWAHDMTLDAANGLLYVTGKSSSSLTAQDIWVNAYQSDSGRASWSVPYTNNFTNAGCWGFQEEIGTGIAFFPDNKLLLSGRSAQLISPGVCSWLSDREIITNGKTAVMDTISGTANGFARGLDALVVPALRVGWVMSLSSSTAYPLGYSFSKYTSAGRSGYEPRERILGQDWPGDCCYDYPSRMAANPTGTVIYTLMGATYSTSDDFGFKVGRFNTGGGSVMTSQYEGTGKGRDVADGLAIGTDGMSVFVLAKTSETGSGFMTRLFCFYDGGVTGNCGTGWATPIPLTADGSPFLDAAFSVAPDGTIWVVESATGRTLQYSQAGLLLKKTQLPGAGGTRYIGSVLAAANGDLYVAGSDGLKAWVAKYSVGDPPPRYACQVYNFPNPFNSNTARTNIRYVLPEAVSVTIDIYDLLGRPVNSWGFAAGERGGRAGMNDNLTWEGQDSSGRKVMSGMYLARLSTKPNVCTQVIRIGVLH